MEVKLYNSLTNKVEIFKSLKENEVSIYVCGPTVYNEPHIGNIRPVVFFDTLRRFFEYIGYRVKLVSNYTDVDDKIIKKAIAEKVDEKVISERYIESYNDSLNKLNILPAYKNPKVTDYMNEIINYIDELVKKGFAYVNNDEVYFNVLKIKDYGILSNTKVEDLISGARIEINDSKKCPLDFLLWKKTIDGIKWHTKWCDGRPGWHTECCVMIDSIFKGVIDIHGGGHDLKFPHHENEIAQQEAQHNNRLANYWVHTAMMNINGDKMSKSLGNVILAKDAINEYGNNLVRMILINAPYRSTINFNEQTINDNKSILTKLITIYKQLNLTIGMNNGKLEGKSSKIETFLLELANDMNIPNAMTILLNTIKEANLELRKKEYSINILEEYFYTLTDIISILGLTILKKEYSNEEKTLYQNYLEAKANKDFEKSDILRKELIKLDIM